MDNAFGEEGHTAETQMEEHFDKLSKENSDRLDREVDAAIEETNQPIGDFKMNATLLRWCEILAYIILGYLAGVIIRSIFGWK